MKKAILFGMWLKLSFLFAVALAARAEVEVGNEAKRIAVGEQASLAVEAGTRFSVGNGEVIQVHPTQIAGGKSLLLVKGKSQGYSDLILLEAGGARHSVAFRVVSKREVLSRRSRSPALPFHLHPLERVKGESRVRRRLREAGFRDLEVKSAGDSVVLTGDADTAADKEIAEALAKETFPGLRSQIRVPFEKGARLRFHARILEVLRDGAQSLGLKWSEEVPGAVQLSPAFAKAGFTLDAALRLLERKGQARLLAQPQLVLNEKGTAEDRKSVV